MTIVKGSWVKLKNSPSFYDSKQRDKVINATLDALDTVAREYDQKWGIDSLPILVSPKTASRFKQARLNLDNALKSEASINEIVAKCEDLERGYKILEKEAIERGYKPEIDKVWYMISDNQEKFAFINDHHKAMYVDDGYKIYNMSEVIRIIESYEENNGFVKEAKKTFPKSEITKITEIKGGIVEDEIPF
tara:strand:- start:5912 stop:6484 length:573 start_codon:yes stop_codon:yes gene_type:complete